MADKEKKYYWLKLPRDFFGKHYIKILRNKENGEYPEKIFGELLVVFYIWLLTECIDHEGRLRYSETTPYDADLLASASGYPLHFVTQALQIFTKLELVVTESDGTLFLPKSLKMIGSESASAKRVREYRQRQEEAKNSQEKPENAGNSDNRYNVTHGNNMKQNGNTEKELEKEKELDKDNKSGKAETMEQIFERLLPDYPISDVLADKLREWIKYKREKKDGYKEQGMKSLLSQVSKHNATHGDIAICNLIDLCMSNGWKGIIWDKLSSQSRSGGIERRVSEVDDW